MEEKIYLCAPYNTSPEKQNKIQTCSKYFYPEGCKTRLEKCTALKEL